MLHTPPCAARSTVSCSSPAAIEKAKRVALQLTRIHRRHDQDTDSSAPTQQQQQQQQSYTAQGRSTSAGKAREGADVKGGEATAAQHLPSSSTTAVDALLSQGAAAYFLHRSHQPAVRHGTFPLSSSSSPYIAEHLSWLPRTRDGWAALPPAIRFRWICRAVGPSTVKRVLQPPSGSSSSRAAVPPLVLRPRSPSGISSPATSSAMRLLLSRQLKQAGTGHPWERPAINPVMAAHVAAERERQRRSEWRRTSRQLFAPRRAATVFHKDLKRLQAAGAERWSRQDEEAKGEQQPLPVNAAAEDSSGSNNSRATPATLHDQLHEEDEKDFEVYCDAFGLSDPRRAFTMARIRSHLAAEARRGNVSREEDEDEVSTVRRLAKEYSREYDALFAKQQQSAAAITAAAAAGSDATTESETIVDVAAAAVKADKDAMKERLRLFQEELPALKQLLHHIGDK